MAPLIKVEDLKQTVGKQIILNSLSFQISSGECLGLFVPGSREDNLASYSSWSQPV